MRVARAVYEALPWAYMMLGVAAIAASYLCREPLWTEALAVSGLLAIVLGLMLVLRRRDYRIQQRRYGAELDDED